MKRMGLMMAGVLLAMLLAPTPARAGYEVIEQTLTIDSGTSFTTTTLTMARSKIVDILLDVPALDSGDTASFHLEVPFGERQYKPRGWTDKTLGATDDDAVVQANASALDMIVDGTLEIGFACSTNQAADRTITVRILREY